MRHSGGVRTRTLLPLLLLAVLPACGGGDDAKADYVQAATTICDRAVAETEELGSPTADFAAYADAVVAIAERAQEDLAALEAPEADAEDLRTRVLEPFADVVEEGRGFAERVRAAGDDTAELLPLLSEVPDAGEVDVAYLRDYGLGSCADAVERGN